MQKTEQQIEQFDLEIIVERLQLTGYQNCDCMASGDVKAAFIKWLNSTVESINNEPEWWVQNHNLGDFYTHLPEPVFECEDNEQDYIQVTSQQKEPAIIIANSKS